VDRQMADALNMMTGNFKALVLGRLREDDTINKIQDDHIVTNFHYPYYHCWSRVRR
jgi:hypothetical protein